MAAESPPRSSTPSTATSTTTPGTGAGQVVYETYFNITGYTQRFELYPGGVQPKTSAEYVVKF